MPAASPAMSTPIPLPHDTGTPAIDALSMQAAGAPVAHAAPNPFNNPLAGSRRHRSHRSAESRGGAPHRRMRPWSRQWLQKGRCVNNTHH
eukprot:9211742-Pyramimonas_sp.AAC.1